MSNATVSQQDFSGWKGESYPAKIPQDSNILSGNGSFAAETHTSAEFTVKSGEHFDAIRFEESDIWKVSLHILLKH